MYTKILVRRGTASEWTSANPTLSLGEIGFEVDTGKLKIGDGQTTWNSLVYNTVTPANLSGAVSAHANRTDNPHEVTKTQVGLGSVPNVDATLRSNHSGTQLSSTISDFNASVILSFAAPTVQKFTSGSGSYTLPSSPRAPLYIRVRMVGGGGGGGGSGAASGNGGSGGNTTFGTSLLVANGGSGGQSGANGNTAGAGGTASLGTGPVGLACKGNSGAAQITSFSASSAPGGIGGSSVFGGAAQSGSGADNSGAGGSGGPSGATTVVDVGAGGGAGGYVDAIIYSPSSTYSFAVGAGGSAGSAGTDGNAGGAGGSGVILVEEYYQ